jgi:hypothetical protein
MSSARKRSKQNRWDRDYCCEGSGDDNLINKQKIIMKSASGQTPEGEGGFQGHTPSSSRDKESIEKTKQDAIAR